MRTRKGTGLFVMAVSQWMFCAAVLLLLVQGLPCSPTPPACPEPCLCQRGLLNCSSIGLSQAQQHIPSTVTELDLSHNLLNSLTPSWPSWGLKNLWLGHNSITHLSLCVRRTWRGKHWKVPLSHSRGRCVSWAPALQLLSAEMNQLEMIPEGLGGSELLQVLQLSHNRISDLRPGDLSRCPLLRELHLQHNRISSLHPLALRDLPELRVLDLSFNLLTTITPSAYLSLRKLNALVEVSGNRWRCDCSLQSLRRKMTYDRDRALQQTWRGVMCSSPSTHAGRDLLHLEDSDLTCSTAENRVGLHQDVTVDKGTEILLPCGSSKQDSTWWTPNGQVPGSQAGLLISDITERDAGLYVCVSGPDEESVSVFDLRVHKTQRKTRDTRSLHRERLQINPELGSIQREGRETDLNSLDLHRAIQRTQSDLVLAVCLSVFITFLVAFVLGALTRPLLDALWRRCCRCCNRTKQSPSPHESVSYAGRAPYDNEAYSDEEEQEELGTHRERRVTFSGHPSELRDQNSIPYYDTVANGRQDNLVGEYDATYENVQEKDTSHPSLEVYHPPEEEKPRARDSVSSGSSQHDSPETDTHSRDRDLSDISLGEPQGGAYPVHTHGMEFKSIPDPDELQGCRSSSVSSHSDQDSPDRGQDMDWPKDNLAQRLEEAHKTRNNPWEPQSPQKEDDSFERSSDLPTVKPVDVPQINIGRVGEIPGFTTEPFADWKSNMADPNPMDPELWNDSGESFEFPDSIRSASARSSSQDLSGSAFADQLRKEYEQAQNKETLVKDQRENDKSSSSSSSDSGNEPTEYTVNPETEVVREKEIVQDALLTHDSTPDPAAVNPYLKHDVSLDTQHYKDPVSPSPDEEGFNVSKLRQKVQRSPVFSEHSDSSSDCRDEPTKYTVNKESDEEEEDEAQVPDVTHKDPSLSLGDINVYLAPRKALNIGFSKEGFQYQPEPETRSTGLDLITQSAISSKEPLPQPSLPSDVARVEDPPVSVYIPRLSKRLDIQPPQKASPAPPKTPPTSESSSSSKSKDETTDNSVKLDREVPDVSHNNSFLSLGDINVSLAPRKALNIGFSKQGFQYQPEPENRSTGLGLSFQSAITPKEPSLPSDGTTAGESQAPFYIPSLRRRLDIQPPQDTPLAAPQTPPPSGSPSSSSESEDETTINQKREEIAKVPDSSFIPAGIDVSFAPRKALNIGFSKEGFQYQSEPNSSGMGLTSQIAISTKQPLPKSSIPSDGTRDEESLVPLYIPRFRRHVDIQPPQETPPAAPRTPPPSGSSSSSSESKELDREVPDVTHKDPFLSLGDINVSIAPRKALNIGFSKEGFQYQPEPETRSPSLGLSSQSAITPKEPLPQNRLPEGTRAGESPLDIPSLRRRLDIQAPQETPPASPGSRPPAGSSSSSSESEDETTMNQKREEKAKVPDSSFIPTGIDVSFAPRKALNIGFSKEGFQYQSEPSLTGMSLSSQIAISTKQPLPKSSIPSDGTRDEESLVPLYIPRFRRHVDIQPPQETPPAAPRTPPPSGSSSSSSESKELDREVPDVTHKDPFLSLGDINVSIAPRKALNIGFSKEGFQYQPEPETRSPSLGLSSQSAITPKEPLPQNRLPEGTRAGESPLDIPSLRRRLDIQAPQETPPASPGSRPPAGSSSSSSESEDETTINPKREEKAKVPDSSFIPAGIDVSFAPRKALNIGFSKEGFQYQSEPSLTGMALTSQSAISTKKPLPKSSIPSDGTRDEESLVPLYIPRFRRHVDIQPPQETPPAAPRTPPPSGSSSSSSESKELDREVPDVTHKDPFLSLGDINVSIAPRKALNIGFSKEGFQYQPEPETRSPSLGLSSQSAITPKEPLPQNRLPEGTRAGESPLDIPSLRRRLDIQAPQETPPASPGSRPPAGSSSSSSESEDETTMNQKREEKAKVPDSSFIPTGIDVSFAPRKALNIGFSKEGFQYQSEPSLTGMALTSQSAISTKKHLPKSSIPSDGTRDEEYLVPLYIPRFRRHVDIQPPQETPPAAPQTPPPSGSPSSSSESEDETTMNQKREEEKAKVPDVTYKYPSLSPGDTPINVSFVPRKALNIGFSKESFQYQSSESKYESITTTNDRGFQEDTKPAPKLSLPKTSILSSASSDRARAEEPPVPLYIPGLRRHQNIQPSQDAPLAKSSSASSENGDELTEHTKKPGRDVTDFSLSPGDTPINVSFTPRTALNIGLYNPASTTDEVERKTGAEDRWDRPGLGGLKALSETQRWDTKDSSTNMNVSFSQMSALNINSDSSTDEVGRRARADYSSPILEGTISRKDGGFEEETNPSPKLSLPKTSRFFSTSTDEARHRESPLQIPRHRRRLVVDIQPPLAPPAAPGTPSPFPEGEEAAGSGWKSRGQQRRRAMDGFGRTAMTQGDEGERSYMGLLAAKPFGTARQYQSITSETIMTTQHSEISERDGSDLTFSTVRHSEA